MVVDEGLRVLWAGEWGEARHLVTTRMMVQRSQKQNTRSENYF